MVHDLECDTNFHMVLVQRFPCLHTVPIEERQIQTLRNSTHRTLEVLTQTSEEYHTEVVLYRTWEVLKLVRPWHPWRTAENHSVG